MDNCFIDITLEFLAVAFHTILYFASIYPQSVFETRRKYSIVVYHCVHPEINEYINLCLKSIGECLKNDQLRRTEFAITSSSFEPLLKFVFDFDKSFDYDETIDAYLINSEQNLRTFFLKLSSLSHKLKDFPEDSSFNIYLHTNESMAIAMASNPEYECFPFVEAEIKHEDHQSQIIPLRRFSIRRYNIDAYVELK